VEVVPAVERFEGAAVHLRGGAAIAPGVVVAATGFTPGLEPLVGALGVLDAKGVPRCHGAAELAEAPGLHFVGFSNPPTGNLREMAIDARRIARAARAARPAAA
jgi:hypothetical protein